MKRRILFALTLAFCFVLLTACSPTKKEETQPVLGSSNHEDLVSLFKEWQEFQLPKFHEGVPDYTAPDMEEQRQGLKKMQERLASFDTSRWTVSQRIDYHLVRAEMNGMEFDHRVLRPWSRDPRFYVTTSVEFGPRMEGMVVIPRKFTLPDDEIEEFRMKLQAVPKILEQAKKNLTEPAADLATFAIRAKGEEIEIYNELASQLAEHHPDLVADAENAVKACKSFQTWLIENKSEMEPYAGVGVENYNWYLKNVQLFPYTWDEIWEINEREYERAMAFLKLEENRNRDLPELEVAKTEEEYQMRYKKAQDEFKKFLREEEIMTIPDYFSFSGGPGSFRQPDEVRDVFQWTGDRDPLVMMAHSTIGHHLDALRLRHDDTRPIRGVPYKSGVGRLYFIDGIRAEALATGLEEMLMHAGLLDERPRSRELLYINLAIRCVRAAADLLIHSNELILEEAMHYMSERAPYGLFLTGSDMMWHDMQLYYRAPGYGMGYLMGKVQIEKLLADRAHQLGDKFKLRQFMDEFVAAGMIPISLTRWEMTGLDDEIKKLW